MFSRRSWEQLSKEDQALVQKAATEAQQEQRKLWDEKVADAIKKLQEVKVTIVSDVDKAAFQASVKPVWDKYGAKYASLIKRIQDTQ